MSKERGMTVNQLIDALEKFRAQVENGGNMFLLTADYDTVGDIEIWEGMCALTYKDLNRLPLRPYAFEEGEK